MAIGDKKASLIGKDGSNITLNKPIEIPSTVTDIIQITEPGWYTGSFIFKTAIFSMKNFSKVDTPYDPNKQLNSKEYWVLSNNVTNIPSFPYSDFVYGKKHYYDLFVTGIGKYIINVGRRLYYGFLNDNISINWTNSAPGISNSLENEASDVPLSAKQGKVLNEKINDLDKNKLDKTGLVIIDNLNTTATDKVLSANQGKVLNETKVNQPIYSTTDLTPGVSKLDDGQLYIVYYD